MEILLIALALVLLIGSIAGLIALVQISELRQQLQQLSQQQRPTSIAEPVKTISSAPVEIALSPPIPAIADYGVNSEPVSAVTPQPTSDTLLHSPLPPLDNDLDPPQDNAVNWISWLEQQLVQRWMVWLGAIALAFGGVFLVQHSLEQGWLSPLLRVSGGMMFGLVLVAGSEWLHRRSQGDDLNSYAPAALASGGFIALYASVLLALQWYQLVPTSVAFAALAIISLSASWFSLRQGPVLAAVGIVGAYAVPILASHGSNQVVSLLGYVCFVTLSSVLVERRVQRPWLWWLPMLAHSLWLTVAFVRADEGQMIYCWLVLLGSLVGLVWLPLNQWQRPHWQHHQSLELNWWSLGAVQWFGMILVFIGALAVWLEPALAVVGMVLFVLTVLLMTACQQKMVMLLGASLLILFSWIVLLPISNTADSYALYSDSTYQFLTVFLLYSLPLLLCCRKWPASVLWFSVFAVVPALMLITSYLVADALIAYSGPK